VEDELIEQWPISELQSIDLGDKRRNERLIRLVAALGGQPGASLPVALGIANDIRQVPEIMEAP
jgi:hypothetical protein